MRNVETIALLYASPALENETVALEEKSDGIAFKEIEYTYYARLSDLSDLKKAKSQEHQEQWELKFPKTDQNGGSGTIRIRKTIETGKEAEYVLTTKTAINKQGDKLEVPIPATVAMFEQFKILSERGMVKDRYLFPIEGTDLVWEVDMFLKPKGKIGFGPYYDWVKIDLEVPDRKTKIPEFPLATEELITAPYGKRTDAEEKLVTGLYDNEFIQKNATVK